jgi:hypothetical protein
MQEPIGVALFFAFLFFVSRGLNPSPIALVCAAAALMTRDAYWIYLFAATLVGVRGLLRNRRRLLTYASLWAVPIFWLAVCVPAIYLVAFGRLPSIPNEWPLMYNPADPIENPVSSFESLRLGLLSSGVLPLATGCLIAFVALAVWAKRNVVQLLGFSEFCNTLIRAVPVALAIMYGLVLLLDPWQVTPGNPRVGWPLLELSFAVAPLLIRAAWSGPAAVRVLVPAAIIAGFSLGVHPQPIQGRTESNASAMREQSKLLQAVSAARLGESPHICVIAQLSWSVFSELDAPLFHQRKTFVSWKRETPNDCDVVIVEDGKGIRPRPGYRPLITITLPERRWSAYVRP